MPIVMLMESLDSLTWTEFSTSVLPVSAPSKRKMLLVATLLGQLNSPIKASPSISPFLAPVRKTPSIDFRLEPKLRRNSVTRCSKAKSCEVLKMQLSGTPMLLISGKLFNHGESSAKVKNKKTAMRVRWNRLPMAIYLDSILTNIATMTTALASMVRPHGSSSPITSRG